MLTTWSAFTIVHPGTSWDTFYTRLRASFVWTNCHTDVISWQWAKKGTLKSIKKINCLQFHFHVLLLGDKCHFGEWTVAPWLGTSQGSKLWFMVKRRGGQINCQINITNFSYLIKPSSKYHSSLHEVIPSRLDRLKVFWQSHQLPGVPPRRI